MPLPMPETCEAHWLLSQDISGPETRGLVRRAAASRAPWSSLGASASGSGAAARAAIAWLRWGSHRAWSHCRNTPRCLLLARMLCRHRPGSGPLAELSDQPRVVELLAKIPNHSGAVEPIGKNSEALNLID